MVRKIPRWLARAPIPLFEAGWGWLAGHRLLMLEHTGRRTGLPRKVVLEVIDVRADTVDVVSGYGQSSQWFLNIKAEPAVRIWLGRVRGASGFAVPLPPADARDRLEGYRHKHPRAARTLGRTLGLGDLATGGPLPPDISRRLPVVAIKIAPGDDAE